MIRVQLNFSDVSVGMTCAEGMLGPLAPGSSLPTNDEEVLHGRRHFEASRPGSTMASQRWIPPALGKDT